MGDCIYLRAPARHRPDEPPEMRILKSEEWAGPRGRAQAGELLGRGHFLNTTAGVWFYEADLLHDRAELCQRLRALADTIESGEADKLYAEARRTRHAPEPGRR